MGMYDNISVSGDLPYNEEMKELGIDINNLTFQTKDLDCLMDSYIIQSNKLFVQKYKSEVWIQGDKNSKTFSGRLGRLERNDPYYEEVKYHGEIYFYDFLQNVKDKWDCWVEYKAIFTDNTLTSIELFKFTKEDSTERLRREKEWQESMEREEKKWLNKYFWYTYPVRQVCRVISRCLYNTGNFITRLSYKL